MSLINIKITVNNQKVNLSNISYDLPLIELLHENLNLTGTKFGCGIADCCACLVLVSKNIDGPFKVYKSCVTKIGRINNMRILTVEGLERNGVLHPLQKAFVEMNAFQCGYSTPGILMRSYKLLYDLRESNQEWKMSEIDEKIKKYLSRHTCRCTGYQSYFDAIKHVILNTDTIQIVI